MPFALAPRGAHAREAPVMHDKVRGKSGLTGESYPPGVPQGISAMSDEDAPRLLLVALTAIIANKFRLIIDGDGRAVSLKTARWW